MAPLAISFSQYVLHPSPSAPMVASRKARPGEEVVAPGVTNRSLYAGSVRSSSVFGAGTFFSANQASSTLTQTSL